MTAVAPRVSTIVPVFNGARYLRDALASLLAQTAPLLEVIVVDDGSTDDSAVIAERVGEPVRVVRQANAGQASALNTGLAVAAGEFVAFLDADDRWAPEKAARQLARFDARPELGYSVTRIRNFLSPEFQGREPDLDPALFRETAGYVVSTLMARRALFDVVGGFDTTWHHANKTAWFLRAREVSVGDEIDEVLVHRRLHTSNMSQQHAGRSLDEYLRLVKQSLDHQRGASR